MARIDAWILEDDCNACPGYGVPLPDAFLFFLMRILSVYFLFLSSFPSRSSLPPTLMFALWDFHPSSRLDFGFGCI